MNNLKSPITFITAGKAIFTVRNEKTGNRFTFKVRQAPVDKAQATMFGVNGKPVWFVSVLNGTDNNSNYAYIGTIKGDTFVHTFKAKVSPEAPSFKAFKWLWEHIKALPENVHIYHEGRCGRCGRKLTVPESIESGFGPECIGKV